MVKDPRGLRAEPAGEDDDRRFSIQVPTPRSWATSVLEGAGDAPMEGAGTGALVNHSPRMDPAVWANGILGLEEGKGGFEQGYFSEGKMEEEDPAHPMDHPIASYHDQDRPSIFCDDGIAGASFVDNGMSPGQSPISSTAPSPRLLLAPISDRSSVDALNDGGTNGGTNGEGANLAGDSTTFK